MKLWFWLLTLSLGLSGISFAQSNGVVVPFPQDPDQSLERTCFQTGREWSGISDLRSDVAIVYGIDAGLPDRIKTWREHGYRIHVMTGVSWGHYQDYLYGRFDGINHEDEAQTVSDGRKSSHGGDVYYMCPGTNYGKYLCVGVQRALDAGAEAIHLEEPEFWVNAGYSEGFKREWKSYYAEDWRAPHSSVDAQWRASKLKYFLYRRALQQVFAYVQDYNRRTGRHVRCYVPTHSLLNYSQWSIVSPESSLALLDGCDGYIGQVWTGTSRTPNMYRGKLRERTFETAFLEYGAMQNLVRSTGRTVWYLNDPIEDNPNYDWNDYQRNWESTLTASLLQPDVWRYEVAPWPERVFGRRYPKSAKDEDRKYIPPTYATELQTVMNALNDMNQKSVAWDCGSTGIGVVIGDSLMFERGDPAPSDSHLSHIYGMALPLLKHGIPVAPVQLENFSVPHYLDGFKVLLMTYQGMKPQTAAIHTPLAEWVKQGGALVFCDDDSDPFNGVREWWNSDGKKYRTPREQLFEQLDFAKASGNVSPAQWRFGKGSVIWVRKNPVALASVSSGADELLAIVHKAAVSAKLKWRETNYLLLQRGPYVVAAGLDESISDEPKVLRGKFINLFDAQLRPLDEVRLTPGSRFLLLDLDAISRRKPKLLASAGKALRQGADDNDMTFAVEGVAQTSAVLLLHSLTAPKSITMDGQDVHQFEFSKEKELLWVHYANEARPRTLTVHF
jgi:hypothetical protein